MATPPPPPSTSTSSSSLTLAQPLSLPTLLAAHHNDPHVALASLVARYNRLAASHAALEQDKDAAERAAERAAVENQQLWRSLKARGSASPRPGQGQGGSSSSSAGVSTGTSGNGNGNGTAAAKGLGIEATGPGPASRSLRRGLSNDSYPAPGSGSSSGLPPPVPSHHAHAHGYIGSPHASGTTTPSPRLASATDERAYFPSPSSHGASAGAGVGHFSPSPGAGGSHPSSPSALRVKAATPPPHGSPRHHALATGPGESNLRKSNSLDLGRGAGGGAEAEEGDTVPGLPSIPATPPARRPSAAASATPSGLTASSSMPLLADPSLSVGGGGAQGQGQGHGEARYLPSVVPVSPFFKTGGGGERNGEPGEDDAGAGGEAVRRRERQASFPSLLPGSGSGSASEGLAALQPGSARRDRTTSTNSALSSAPSQGAGAGAGLGSGFLESLAGAGTLYQPSGGGSEGENQRDREREKKDRRRSMFLPPTRSGSGGGSLASFGGGGGAGGMASAASTSSLAALAGEGAPAPRERRPSKHLDAGPGSGAGVEPSASARRLPPPPPATPPPPPRPSLTPAMLPLTRVKVTGSAIKMNDKHREVIAFTLSVSTPYPSPSNAPPFASGVAQQLPPEDAPGLAHWRVEKMYSDVLALDAAVKSRTNRQESKSMASLPDKSLFKDHAPHRGDQRKAVLERYLQTLLSIPLRDRSAVCAFFNTDVVASPLPSSSLSGGGAGAGADGEAPMAGWLTKRGRNFGGWQTRYYVLEPGRALVYYDSPNGARVGEIPLDRAAIGRQSSSSRSHDQGDDAYLHAFLIRARDDKDQEADHILCAENDEMRDRWVHALTTLLPPPRAKQDRQQQQQQQGNGHPPPVLVPPSPSSDADPSSASSAPRSAHSLGDRRLSGSGPPSASTSTSSAAGPEPSRGLLSVRGGDALPPSVSLPSDLSALANRLQQPGASSSTSTSAGANGVDPPPLSTKPNKLQPPPSRRPSGQVDRPVSPHRPTGSGSGAGLGDAAVAGGVGGGKYSASDVSGPMNAVPLPSGYEFKRQERQKKTKSSFWGFASRSSDKSSSVSSVQAAPAPPSRPVFGVPLKEAVAISRIRPGLELPAIVYRCVEYLEAKNAEHEEGIFRLSGSANVIRVLKDRFNAEGDVPLLQSNEYYDPHAIAGLLKQYLRELPVHLLTRELHGEFLRVIDLRNRLDRVNALGKLVARLPIEEYTLFRFFFAHLCLIAQNAETSKMNLRNLGIVFSPTLAIPAPLFTLLLAEFDLVFAVEKDTGVPSPLPLVIPASDPAALEEAASPTATTSANSAEGQARKAVNRNSLLYQASGADKLMEGELTSLRENDDDEASLPDESEPFASADTDAPVSATDTLDGPPSSASYLSAAGSAQPSPTLPPIPKSPGLPASPRPGGSFSPPPVSSS
ncbi:hypothetical protein JCM10207_007035 [Rhodosporidiobolus poonsookiae]